MKTWRLLNSAMAVAALLSAHAEGIETIALETFPAADVNAYPVEIGFPFPEKTLTDPAHIRLLAHDGTEVRCQVEALSRYLDGSLRAALLVFTAPMKKDAPGNYTVEFGEDVARKAQPASRLTVTEKDGAVTADTGALSFGVNKGRFLMSNVKTEGSPLLKEGVELFIREAGQEGELAGDQREVVIEERGPVRAVIRVTGRFGSAPDAPAAPGAMAGRHGYVARIHAYAGSTLVRLQYTVLGLDAKKPFELAGWGLRAAANVKKAACGVDGEIRGLSLGESGGLFQNGVFEFTQGNVSPEECLKRARAKGDKALKPGDLPGWHYRLTCAAGAEEPFDARADGWLGVETGRGSMGICVRDFWQQFPKEWTTEKDSFGVWLHSPKAAPFMGKPGTAKTHEILFDFAPGNAVEGTCVLNTVFQDWPRARVAPAWVCASGAHGPLLPREDPFTQAWNDEVDTMLVYLAQHEGIRVSRASWYVYGNADFGDIAKSIISYNVPGGHTQALTREFLRGGSSECARIGARAARHYADIDVCHAAADGIAPGFRWIPGDDSRVRMAFPPFLRSGGSTMQMLGARNAEELAAKAREAEAKIAAVPVPRDTHQGAPATTQEKISWANREGSTGHAGGHTGGALSYYLMSGDRRSLEVIREQGDWTLAALAKARADSRTSNNQTLQNSLWLCVLMDAFDAAGDVKYLRGAGLVIQDLIALWRIPPEVRSEYRELKKQMEAGKAKIEEWQLPRRGFWHIGRPREAGRWIMAWVNRDEAAFRFYEANVPEAGTGADNEEVKRMLSDCMAAFMLATDTYCTPSYIYEWTMAANLGLWEEDVRREFETKTLSTIALGRNVGYFDYRYGKKPSPVFRYRIPFLRYDPGSGADGGRFLRLDTEAIAREIYNIYSSPTEPYTCHVYEYGVDTAFMGYPQFLKVWKEYQDAHLASRINDECILEFTIGRPE